MLRMETINAIMEKAGDCMPGKAVVNLIRKLKEKGMGSDEILAISVLCLKEAVLLGTDPHGRRKKTRIRMRRADAQIRAKKRDQRSEQQYTYTGLQ